MHQLKQIIDEAIAGNVTTLYLGTEDMAEAVKWLSPDKPLTNRLQLFRKRELILVIEPIQEIHVDEFLDIIQKGRDKETEQLNILWDITDFKHIKANKPQPQYAEWQESSGRITFDADMRSINELRKRYGFTPISNVD